jgi:hypothetical protein
MPWLNMFYNIHIFCTFSFEYKIYVLSLRCCWNERTTTTRHKKIGATIKAAFTISEGKYSGFLLKNKDNVENLHKERI